MMTSTIKTMKFIAGQVWLLQIVTEQLDGSKTKFRPYLVIAANNRRLTLLRVTHGGKLATNWLEPFGVDKHGEEQNIILDAPISVQTCWIQKDMYLYQLDADDFRYIMRKHIAAMLYQCSIPNFLNDEDVAAIKETIANHTDGMYAFGKYMPIAGIASDDEDDEDDDTDNENAIDDTDENVEEVSVPERISMVVESDDALSELRDKIRYADPDDAVALTAEYRKAAATVNQHIERNPDNVPRRVSLDAGLKGVSVNDIIIPGGSTKYDDIKAQAEALKISGQKFKFGFDEIRRNGITYENQRCGCTLKRDINTSKSSKYHMIPEDMYDILYNDACRFGIKATAAIWKCSETTVRRICNIVE